MTQPGILEIIVCSEADAAAAVDGGADRLEVISHYEAGGLTQGNRITICGFSGR